MKLHENTIRIMYKTYHFMNNKISALVLTTSFKNLFTFIQRNNSYFMDINVLFIFNLYEMYINM
jgi:hypothetical protein